MRAPRKSVARSFAHALDGVMFVLRTQRHMQVHCVIITLVLFAALGLRVSPLEMLMLMSAMALVLVTEMINTAIESAIDISVSTYNPQAKTAKDVAAGAVLIAAFYSIVVGVTVFVTNERLIASVRKMPQVPSAPRLGEVQIVGLGLVFLALLIGAVKRWSGRGTIMRGGVLSGHSAAGFFMSTCIFLFTRSLCVTALAGALALLIAQSRVQANIHSLREVTLGGLLGAVVAVLLYWPYS
ncbi:MAG: phosphatase PAP2 family protein [Armatimonadetes bacterium]|nr:phosphatase PAP2 family protein [Armatimonadota bacterium]